LFGPLPQLHRLLFVAVALLVCVALGAWVAYMTPIPLLWTSGAALGAVLGVGATYLLVHQPPAATARQVSRRR
jgi:hypothetical protein